MALPGFVRQELEGYLDCGLLCRGFALLKCSECTERRLVAFCCKGRGFCPCCLGRRMCQSAANLIDHVVPQDVALRQWVLTLPHALRYRLAYDGKLLGAVCRIFVDSVLGWYRRRLTQQAGAQAKGGAVVAIQRVSSDLRLHPHFHAVVLDGVYVEHRGGGLEFMALPHLSTTEVADVLQLVRARIVGYLQRRNVIEQNDELSVLDDELREREPALADLARAAVSGLEPAGPELRRRLGPISLRGRPGVEILRPLCAQELGFNLHAATGAGALDADGREALL
ncbi:MAG TPA: transposase zinc-binding domain-containing protein, partial [Polyangiaceae bacterium]